MPSPRELESDPLAPDRAPPPSTTPSPGSLPTIDTHSPEQIERAWRRQVYRGDRVPQLTARALLTGALLGAAMGLSNLYVGLKIGWSLGVVVTASILGWAAWRGLTRAGVMRAMPSILEANAMASTASAAGYSTGTTLVSAVAALLLVTGEPLPLGSLVAWLLSVSLLGVFIALPLKRALVDAEQLPFPAGAAAAEALRRLYDAGADARPARALVGALAVGVAVEVSTSVLPALASLGAWPPWLSLPGALPTPSMQDALPWLGGLAAHGFTVELSVLVPAAGALVGWRMAWSIAAGALVCFGGLVPALLERGLVASTGYREVVAWSVWPGTTLMTVAGLVGFAGAGRRMSRARRGARSSPTEGEPSERLDVSVRVVAGGLALAGAACVALQVGLFEIPVAAAVLSVALAVVLTVVAARVTAQTDVTPMGPLGKLAQLAGGLTMPGRVAPGLMAASVTAGAAASAADLLTDLKSGRLLGAHPGRQFIAQLVGVVVGVAVTAPVFRYVLVPDASALGGARWPAPAARVWVSVSAVVSDGLAAVPPSALWASGVAGLVALALALAEQRRPRWRPWLPSATGLGLAFVLPPGTALSFLLGGLCIRAVSRRGPPAARAVAVPVAAGLIAGESLMGIASAVLTGWAR